MCGILEAHSFLPVLHSALHLIHLSCGLWLRGVVLTKRDVVNDSWAVRVTHHRRSIISVSYIITGYLQTVRNHRKVRFISGLCNVEDAERMTVLTDGSVCTCLSSPHAFLDF